MKDYGSVIFRKAPWLNLPGEVCKSPTFQISATEDLCLADAVSNIFEDVQKLKEEQIQELDSIFRQQLDLRGLEVDEVYCEILEDRERGMSVYRVTLSGHVEAIFIIECPIDLGCPVLVQSDLWAPCNVSYDKGIAIKEE